MNICAFVGVLIKYTTDARCHDKDISEYIYEYIYIYIYIYINEYKRVLRLIKRFYFTYTLIVLSVSDGSSKIGNM